MVELVADQELAQMLFKNFPRTRNRCCRNGEELRRPTADDITKLHLQRPEKLRTAGEIVLGTEHTSNVGARVSCRPCNRNWRQPKEPHNRP
jgi:hypothetical protein